MAQAHDRDGFGPVSVERSTDFTIAFEGIVLMALPSIMLVVSVATRTLLSKGQKVPPQSCNSSIVDEKNTSSTSSDTLGSWLVEEDSCLSHKILLGLKVFAAFLSAIGLLACGTLVASQRRGDHIVWQSTISGCIISACGMAFAGVLSIRQHTSTWRPSSLLQIFGLLSILSTGIRVRTAWLTYEETSNGFPELLSVVLGSVLIWTLLEGLGRASAPQIQKLAPYIGGSLLHLASFHFAQPLFTQAFNLLRQRKILDETYAWPLGEDMSSAVLASRWDVAWKTELERSQAKKKHPRFWLTLLRLTGGSLVLPICLTFLWAVAQYANPNLLNGFLDWLANLQSQSHPSLYRGFEFAIGFLVMTTLAAILNANALFYSNLAFLRMRSMLVGAIYRKLFRLSAGETSKRSVGDILTLVNVDAEVFTESDTMIQALFGMPLQLALGIYFLYQQLNWAVFPGLAWLIAVCCGLQSYTARFMGRAFARRLRALDGRTTLVNRVITAIKFVKLFALEKPFVNQILERRAEEIKALKRLAWGMTSINFTTQLARNGTSVVMFAVYAATTSPDRALNANRIFVSLTLIEIITAPIERAAVTMQWIFNLLACCRRISRFLQAGELDSTAWTENAMLPEARLLDIRGGTFAWSEESSFRLRGIDLAIEKGQFLVVVGKVGSGKSSLLHAILGNMDLRNGSAARVAGLNRCMGYCSQDPFIMSGTVQDNILFGLPLSQSKLDRVLEACALSEDIDTWEGGLQCELGEKGHNLSGGQRARISLARVSYYALLGITPLVILDDVLSAVDPVTERHIFTNVLSNEGVLGSCARIFVTHNVRHAVHADRIVVMDDGKLVQSGTYADITTSEGMFRAWMDANIAEQDACDIASPLSVADKQPAAVVTSKKQAAAKTEQGKLVSAENMFMGKVSWRVFLAYFKLVGWWRVLRAVGLFGLSRTSYMGSQFWMTHFANISDEERSARTPVFIGVYALLCGLCCILSPAGGLATVRGLSIVASRGVFENILLGVLRAPMSWFDVTPSSRTMNRLGSDMSQVDWQLGSALTSFTSIVTLIFASLISTGISTPWFFILLPFTFVLYYFLLVYYQSTSRSVRRLDAGRTRAPIYQHVLMTAEGKHVISALGLQSSNETRFNTIFDTNQRAKCMTYACQGWLLVRAEAIAGILSFAAACFTIVSRHYIPPSLAGLALAGTINITSFLSYFVVILSNVENAAVHVERILELVDLNTEADLETEDDKKLQDWPQNGCIKFSNVDCRYREGQSLVLKNVSFEIVAGKKVAVVGRTGSGKSTLTLTLFRILEIDGGTISIDGVDISKLGLTLLRRSISIIPQEIAIFDGSLRRNLSPFDEYNDTQLWSALEAAHLKALVAKGPSGLDSILGDGGIPLSHGQLQQLGLARALLCNAKILILDEATSSLDKETDNLIQRTIRRHFAECTVITIAHRIDTVLDNDLVLVMDQGTPIEYDSPATLLDNPSSAFFALAKESSSAVQ